MTVKIINTSTNPLPEYATAYSAGLDLRAHLGNAVELMPMERKLIPTGLFIELPPMHEAQVRPRSGLALKSGVTVLNAPGTIDADYRGEIKVLLVNLSDSSFLINSGDRIAQLVVNRHERVEWQQADILEETARGQGGFGHTGKS